MVYIRDAKFKIHYYGNYWIDTAFKKDKMKKYQNFWEKCIQGKIGFRPDFYIIEDRYKEGKDRPKENIDVTIVSTTKAAVEQVRVN